MPSLKRFAAIALALGCLSLASLLLAHLALTDIVHQVEPKLDEEWTMVRLSFLLLAIYVPASLVLILEVRHLLT